MTTSYHPINVAVLDDYQGNNLLATPYIGYVSRGLYERFYRDTGTNISTWLDEKQLSPHH